jgi:hypothetical protein
MKRFKGTETVPPGLYLNLRQVAFKSLDEEGPLPGGPGDVWRAVPTLMLLVVGPLMGLAFVVFLPLICFAMVGWLLALKSVRIAAAVTRAATRVIKPGWEPSLAFLSRSRPAKGAAPETDEWAKAARKKLDHTERDAA